MHLLFRIVEKLFLLYFATYLLMDIVMFVYALIVFRRRNSEPLPDSAFAGHSVSIIVPGFNEEVTAVHCLKQLLLLDYPDYDLIFVNDGSTDSTLASLQRSFQLRAVSPAAQNGPSRLILTKGVRGVFSTPDHRLTVIDKANGGKADSINAGINHSTKRYICTIDADSILDPTSLKSVLVPMINSPETFVAGGQLAAANDVRLDGKCLRSGKMPRNIWVLWQIIEYVKSFMVAKIGLSRTGALLIMSGAFSLYRKSDLLAVGGFLTRHNNHAYLKQTVGIGHQTVCEDMEIVVRLWRYYRGQGRRARASFIPNPVCWTEVPEKPANLFRQRTRWHLGLVETLKIHRDMIFEPRFGATGMLALPYYFLFELLSPVVKLMAAAYLAIAIAAGCYNGVFIGLLVLSVLLLTAILTSTISVTIELWSRRQIGSNRQALRYQGTGEWVRLIGYSIVGDFFYGFFKTAAQIKGLFDFARKKSAWNKFERKGFIQAWEQSQHS